MASHVVDIDSLAVLFGEWIAAVSRYCGEPSKRMEGSVVHVGWDRPYVPEGHDPEYIVFGNNRRPRGNPFFEYKQGLFESLEGPQWERIKWYYYCDNVLGNTIRLYDSEHFEYGLNREVYLELEGNGYYLGIIQAYPDRVLIRGENLERETMLLKRDEFRCCFSKRWSARNAPGFQQAKVDLEGMCEEFFTKRHAYFQYTSQNHMPGNTLQIDCDSRCTREPCTVNGKIPAVIESNVGDDSLENTSLDLHPKPPLKEEMDDGPETGPTVESSIAEVSRQTCPITLFGYSELGMINALCDDILYAAQPLVALETFLSLCRFPFQSENVPDFSNTANVTILVEQSFSDFGDLDLLILIEHKSGTKQAVLLEAKVATATSTPRGIQDHWQDFLAYLVGGEDIRRKKTSSLFVQLYRKLRLVRQTQDLNALLDADSVAGHWSLGANRVVRQAAELLAAYREHPWFVALVPDQRNAVNRFFQDRLRSFSPDNYNLPDWDVARWGYITWPEIEEKCSSNSHVWKRTLLNFSWNKRQIYGVPPTPPDREDITRQVGQVLLYKEHLVLVVVSRKGDRNCRVAPLTGGGKYFPKTKVVEQTSLVIPDTPVDTPDTTQMQPVRKSIYVWNPPTGEVYQPSRRSTVPQPPERVRVQTPGWEISAVCQVDDEGNKTGREFHVYNHHLQRA